jgi:hypothetical protein
MHWCQKLRFEPASHVLMFLIHGERELVRDYIFSHNKEELI